MIGVWRGGPILQVVKEKPWTMLEQPLLGSQNILPTSSSTPQVSLFFSFLVFVCIKHGTFCGGFARRK